MYELEDDFFAVFDYSDYPIEMKQELDKVRDLQNKKEEAK